MGGGNNSLDPYSQNNADPQNYVDPDPQNLCESRTSKMMGIRTRRNTVLSCNLFLESRTEAGLLSKSQY